MLERYQIWLDKKGHYALVSGKACDEPILTRVGQKVHEFMAPSKDRAEFMKELFVKQQKVR